MTPQGDRRGRQSAEYIFLSNFTHRRVRTVRKAERTKVLVIKMKRRTGDLYSVLLNSMLVGNASVKCKSFTGYLQELLNPIGQ